MERRQETAPPGGEASDPVGHVGCVNEAFQMVDENHNSREASIQPHELSPSQVSQGEARDTKTIREVFRSRKYGTAVDGSFESYDSTAVCNSNSMCAEVTETDGGVRVSNDGGHPSRVNLRNRIPSNNSEETISVETLVVVRDQPRRHGDLKVDNGNRLQRSPNAHAVEKQASYKGRSREERVAPHRTLSLGVGDSAIGRLVRQLSGQQSYAVYAEEEFTAAKQPKTYFDLSLFALCCCLSPFGAVAMALSVMSDSNFKSGQIEKAKKYGRMAMALSITGMVTTLLVAVALLLTVANPWTNRTE